MKEGNVCFAVRIELLQLGYGNSSDIGIYVSYSFHRRRRKVI